ncbi:MAG TPA: hypothetical protein VH592_18890 [Gemmataceae bacterium]
MSPTSDRTSETHELFRRILHTVTRGNRLIAELHQMQESLAELTERVTALKVTLWPSGKSK